jgi:RNA polymerase-associated protein LEO1
MSDSEDPVELPDDGGDDLFGDEEGIDAISEVENGLSDRELASDGEDENSNRRRDAVDDDEPTDFREKLISDVPLYRHPIPKSKDDSVSHLNHLALSSSDCKI